MKKIIFAVLLLLVAAWAGATWLIGSGIEKGVQNFYDTAELRIAESGNNAVAMEPGDIQRSFFASDATTKVSLTTVPMDDATVTVHTKLYHGPVMFTSDGVKVGSTYAVSTVDTSEFPAEVQEVISKGFDDEEPVRFTMLFGFGGEVDMVMEMPLFRYVFDEPDGGQSKVEFAGMTVNASGTAKGDGETVGNLEIGEIKITNDAKQSSFTTEVGTGEFEAMKSDTMVGYTGTATFNIPEIKAGNAGGELSFKDVGLSADSSVDPESGGMNAAVRYEFASASTSDPDGPVGAVFEQLGDGGYIDYKIENWDLEALQKFQEAQTEMTQIQVDMMSAMMGGESDDDFDPEKAGEKLDKLADQAIDGLLELFKPGMLFEFRTKLGDGESRSDLKLGIAVADGAVAASKADTLGQIVNGLLVDIDVRLSKTMLPPGLAEMFLAQPIQAGMIEDRGDYFRGTGELKDSKVSVNGNEFPILQQVQPFLDSPDGMAGFRQGMKQSLMGSLGGAGGAAADLPADMDEEAPAPAPNPAPAPAPAPAPGAAPEPAEQQ